jgi:hypothetical protein
MGRARHEQELGPDRDHVGSHVGSANDLESRRPTGSLAPHDTNLPQPARRPQEPEHASAQSLPIAFDVYSMR